MPFPDPRVLDKVFTQYQTDRQNNSAYLLEPVFEAGWSIFSTILSPLVELSSKSTREARIDTSAELKSINFDKTSAKEWYDYVLKLEPDANSGEKRLSQLREWMQGYILSCLLADKNSQEYQYVTSQPGYSEDKCSKLIKNFNDNEMFKDQNIRRFLPYSSFEELQKDINSGEEKHDFPEEKDNDQTANATVAADTQSEPSLIRTMPITPAHGTPVAESMPESIELPLQSNVAVDNQTTTNIVIAASSSATASMNMPFVANHENVSANLLLPAQEPPKTLLAGDAAGEKLDATPTASNLVTLDKLLAVSDKNARTDLLQSAQEVPELAGHEKNEEQKSIPTISNSATTTMDKPSVKEDDKALHELLLLALEPPKTSLACSANSEKSNSTRGQYSSLFPFFEGADASKSSTSEKSNSTNGQYSSLFPIFEEAGASNSSPNQKDTNPATPPELSMTVVPRKSQRGVPYNGPTGFYFHPVGGSVKQKSVEAPPQQTASFVKPHPPKEPRPPHLIAAMDARRKLEQEPTPSEAFKKNN